MSGDGSPELALDGCSDLRVCVVAASWHTQVMAGLIDGADRALEAAGIVGAPMLQVPGAFELPVASMRAARSGSFDAVVALGVVIRGGTPHFEYVCSAATDGLVQVTVSTGVPVGFGLLTCDTEQQALDRAGLEESSEDKGYEAASAALVTARTLRHLP
jgi:6,7-dimethyl-8-ribityllumazine synthase